MGNIALVYRLRDIVHVLAGALALLGAALLEVNKPARGEEVRVGGTGSALGTIQVLAEAYGKSRPEVRIVVVPNLGSGGGIKAVITGAIHIGLSARPLKDSEMEQGARGLEYGRTPFLFATSAKRPGASALTTEQVLEIYSGKTDRWPGGARVRLVLRPETDSDTELLERISPQLRQAAVLAGRRPGMLVAINDQEAADQLETLPGSLGTTTLAIILSEKRGLRALKLDGAEPSVKGLAGGEYPYYKQMILVTGPKTPASATGFVAFIQSPAGRQILTRIGHWVK